MSDLHRQEIQGLMTSLKSQVKKATDEELEASASRRPLFLLDARSCSTRWY